MRLSRIPATILAALAAAFAVPAAAQDPVAESAALIGQYDYEGAIELLEPACKAGNAEACWRLALAHSRNYSDESTAAADKQFLANCAKGDARSCFMVARRIGYTEDPKDQAKARTALTKACDGGLGFACPELGSKLQYNDDEKLVDRPGAARAYGRGCDLGFAESCRLASDLLRFDAEGNEGDTAGSLAYAIKGCDLGSAAACSNIPNLESAQVEDAATVEQMKRWQGFYEKACRLGESDSCFSMLNEQLEIP